MSQRAFSLVELSIVLVILGLLTGGIMAGQSLIHASELRALTTQYHNITAAEQNFQTKYGAIPGDFQDATKYWGRENSNADCIANYGAAVNTATGVCDGNGDNSLSLSAAGGQASEAFQFWRHLAMAGMLDGKYTGIAGAANSYASTPDVNVPSTKITSGGWFVSTWGTVSGSTFLFNGDYGNIYQVGAASAADPANLLFSPIDMQSLDTKMDDGMPATGKLVARSFSTCTTAAANSQLSATYLVNSNSALCVLIFRNQY